MNRVLAVSSVVAALAAIAAAMSTASKLRALEERVAKLSRPVVRVESAGPEAPPPVAERIVGEKEAPAAVPKGAEPVAPAFKEEVRKVLDEVKREEDAKWQERLKRSGVDVIAKAAGLTTQQQEMIAPLVEEHLKAVQSVWWPGTVKDEQGQERALSYEEKVKLSEEARAKVDARVRLFLMGAQRDAYDAWVKQWREEAPKRTGETGPLRWF
jgi:hypothetical protein